MQCIDVCSRSLMKSYNTKKACSTSGRCLDGSMTPSCRVLKTSRSLVGRERCAKLRDRTAAAQDEFCSVSDDNCSFPDPEAKYVRYGKHFGSNFKLQELIARVPRVRVRTPREAVSYRQQEELVELALLNARLAGEDTWEARTRLEYLKIRRENWEKVYNYVTKQDAAATLALIEEACAKVEETLSEESKESQSVTALNQSLQILQQEVEEAQEKLNVTQKRVEQNLDRVKQLKAEAVALERLRSVQVAEAATVISSTQTVDATQAARASTRPRTPASLRKRRSLQSSLELEEALQNFWYPVHFSSKLTKDLMVPFELFGQPWVLFRDANGEPACVRDECAHRACPLSVGRVVDGQVECAYHGWQYNSDGHCTKMPSTVHCRNIAISSLPTVERDGFIMVWPGNQEPTEVPDTRPPYGFEVHAEIEMEVPVEHGLLVENLLDLAHAPFTHTSTFAKGWPVPDMVRFHANKLLSGSWDPYPIDMCFMPPCMTVSLIGLAQPGKIVRGAKASSCKNHLHQLHVCLPSKKGHTRLLYRMSMDFLAWIKHVPLIAEIWKSVASQVLNEDLVLVKGQQERLMQGGDTWANPVSYDKLGVRYRQWRNTLQESERVVLAAPITMSAGQLFELNDEVFVDEQDV